MPTSDRFSPFIIAVGGFVLSLVVGFCVLREVVRFAFPERPHTEAYEGAGNAMLAWHCFLMGMLVWAVVSFAVALRIAWPSLGDPPSPPPVTPPSPSGRLPLLPPRSA